jgi:hypothetical protein
VLVIDDKNKNDDGIFTTRKETMMENKESISLGGRENSMQRSKIRKDNALCFTEVWSRYKKRTRRRRKGGDL